LAFSYWIDYLGFITEGKLAAIFIKPSLGISNWPVIYYTFPCQLGIRSFLSPLPGIEEAPTSSSPRHQGRGQGLGRAALLCGWPVAPLRLLFGLLEASLNNRRFGFCFIKF
jgi:hypothetical protein